MIKIWFKTFRDNSLTISKVFTFEKDTDINEMLVEMCHDFDLPFPVVLSKHLREIEEFKITKFSKSDFVESLDDDYVEIEVCSE